MVKRCSTGAHHGPLRTAVRHQSAHFSAVRSVAWTAADSALSLGLDRRLRLWRVELEEQAQGEP